MVEPSDILHLPARLDLAAAAPLWADLTAKAGRPLVLDASAVQRLGGLCLQVLLSAQASWRDAGLVLTVAQPSDAFIAAYADYGAELLPSPAGERPA